MMGKCASYGNILAVTRADSFPYDNEANEFCISMEVYTIEWGWKVNRWEFYAKFDESNNCSVSSDPLLIRVMSFVKE